MGVEDNSSPTPAAPSRLVLLAQARLNTKDFRQLDPLACTKTRLNLHQPAAILIVFFLSHHTPNKTKTHFICFGSAALGPVLGSASLTLFWSHFGQFLVFLTDETGSGQMMCHINHYFFETIRVIVVYFT